MEPEREGTAGKKPHDGNRSGGVPLKAGSDQEALLQDEDEPGRRRGRGVLRSGYGKRLRLRDEIEAVRDDDRQLDEFEGERDRLSAIGNTRIFRLATGTGQIGRGLLVYRDPVGAARGGLFTRSGIRLRETTAQRVCDENREKQCGKMSEDPHGPMRETANPRLTFKL